MGVLGHVDEYEQAVVGPAQRLAGPVAAPAGSLRPFIRIVEH
jgi:hypothetical protein